MCFESFQNGKHNYVLGSCLLVLSLKKKRLCVPHGLMCTISTPLQLNTGQQLSECISLKKNEWEALETAD